MPKAYVERTAAAMSKALADTVRLTDPLALRKVNSAAVPAVVEVPREDARPLSLIYLPVSEQHHVRSDASPRARAFVVVHDPDTIVRLKPELIARVHDITPTEATLAAALVEGSTLAEFAAARGSSEHTVRTHMKRILDKTGTSRQADLVRLLLGSAALHLGAADAS